MPSLSFVVPVHGRWSLASVCLRQLRRTCDQLIAVGIEARAVVISDAETLHECVGPLELGFATIERDNAFTSRRFNDGIQLATDPSYGEPADFVVPFGSDDWADHRLFLEPLPQPNQIQGFQHMSFVDETGMRMARVFLNYEGGAGLRIIPRELVAPLGYRPADEDRERGCDTSILRNLRRHHGDALEVKHMEAPAHWIVDWKTHGEQLNPFTQVIGLHGVRAEENPFETLVGCYPDEALLEMAAHYAHPFVAVA